MDEKYLEQASAVTENMSADTLAAIRRDLARPGQADCEDCGDPIPEGRRLAVPSAIRCVACQSALDHLKKGFVQPDDKRVAQATALFSLLKKGSDQ